MKKILLLFLVLFPIIAVAQPPPIQTLPISVDPLTQILYPTDATTGIITDAMSAMSIKPSCRVNANTNITLTLAGTPIVDSLTLAADDIVLCSAQTTASQNGPWVVTSSGPWTRPAWYPSGGTVQAYRNILTYVRAGTLRGGLWNRCATLGAITIDTTSTSWAASTINLSVGVTGTLLAGQFPALTGPVTTTAGSLATTITNAAVTYAKIQDIAGLSVIGRSANSSGVAADITGTDGQALRVSGTTLGFGTIVAAGIASDAVITAKILDANVTLAKLADVATGTVFYRKTAGTGVPEVQALATLKTDLGLTGTNSGDQTITLTGDVTGSGTASFAATIGSAAVTYAKIQNIAGLSVFGRSANSSGVGADITGTDGQVLRVSGTTLGFGTVAPAGGGTGTGTAFTTGSVVFAGASGVYTQNNSKLFWDNTNNRLGIGTASPTDQIHISGAGTVPTLRIQTVSGSAGTDFATLRLQSATRTWQFATGGPASTDWNGAWYVYNEGTNHAPFTINGSDNIGLGGSITGQTLTGASMAIVSGDIGMGIISSLQARLHVVKTTKQMRIAYDGSNYYDTTVNSTGGVSLDAVGTGASFSFEDTLNLAYLPSGSPTPAPVAGHGRFYITSAGVLTYVSSSDGAGGPHTTSLANQ